MNRSQMRRDLHPQLRKVSPNSLAIIDSSHCILLSFCLLFLDCRVCTLGLRSDCSGVLSSTFMDKFIENGGYTFFKKKIYHALDMEHSQ